MDDDGRSKNGFFSRFAHKINGEAVDEEVIEGEIASMLNEGQDQGVINESEAEMITNIFQLDDISAEQIMTHRTNLAAFDGEKTLEDVISLIAEENFSRYPVYLEDIDNVIGILHIKDFLFYYKDEINRNKRIKDIEGILQKAVFIPETSKIDNIFKNMQSSKTHMDIVVDEYGQTAGIVCMEDILEEIVGNIFDEHDEVEYNVIKTEDNVYQIKGLTLLTEITEETGVEYSDSDFDTINGYLIAKLDRIPDDDVGTVIADGCITYKILSVEDKTISLVEMKINESDKGQED